MASAVYTRVEQTKGDRMNNKTAKRLRRIAKKYCELNEKANFKDAVNTFKRTLSKIPQDQREQQLLIAEHQVGLKDVE